MVALHKVLRVILGDYPLFRSQSDDSIPPRDQATVSATIIDQVCEKITFKLTLLHLQGEISTKIITFTLHLAKQTYRSDH